MTWTPAATRPKAPRWWCSPFGKEPLNLRATASALTGPGGAILPPTALSLRLVDYVPAIAPADPLKQTRRWPDVLRPLPEAGFTLTPGESRLLWLTVTVPPTAIPGPYQGFIELVAADGETQRVPIRLRVYDVLLPGPRQWALRVDFWQGFGHLARRYGVADWSEDWWALAETFLSDLAAHGQSVVQVGRGHFDWRKRADGAWDFGFERFDRYVEWCARVGITGPIEYLQMFDGRGDTRLTWTGADGKNTTVVANPGDPAFDDLWGAFAQALAAHCREQGWLARLYICPTDEPRDAYGPPTLERFRRAVAVLKQADPGARVTVALDSLASARDLAPLIDRFVFKLRADVYDPAWARQLRASGKWVETYICCHPDRPNSFITSLPVEQRVIGWICRQEGFDGLLRWSYVNWPADPFGKPEGDGKYTAGDLFIVYPGDRAPLASTRWERMRDGFEDYEMLRAVERLIAKAPAGAARDAATQALSEAYAKVVGPPGKLTAYATDPNVLLTHRRRLLECAEQLK